MNNLKELFGNNIDSSTSDEEKLNAIQKAMNIQINDQIALFWSHCEELNIDDQECYVSPLVDLDYYLEVIEDLDSNFEQLMLEEGLQPDKELIPDSVKKHFYHKKWIPFIVIDGIHCFLDLDPVNQNHTGQLIVKDVMGGDDQIKVIYQSIDDFAHRIIQESKSGNLTVQIDGKTMNIHPNKDSDDVFCRLNIW